MPHARELATRFQALDKPGIRKIHGHVMPRCGGLAMALGTCVPIMLWAPKTAFVNGLLIGALNVVIFGLADDIKDLKPKVKLLGQAVAALIVILVGGIKISDIGPLWTSALPDWAAIPLTVFVIVGVTNATNLSDGLDGLAGGIALMIFFCIGYLGMIANDWVTVLIAIAVGGSVLGLLRFNSYPAQLFMGDAGSQFLGFVAIVLAIKVTQQSSAINVCIPLIIFGIPILDTISVMIKRMAVGRSPFSADQNHFHHQLMATGLTQAESVLAIYLVQSLLIIFAIVYHGANGWLILSAYLLFSGSVLGAFHLIAKTQYRIEHFQALNTLRALLKPLKDRGQIIKFSFAFVKFSVPSLLIFNALFYSNDNIADFFISGSFLFLALLTWFFNALSLNRVAKTVFYMFTPYLIYRCDSSLYTNLGPMLVWLYNSLYLLLFLAVFLTMKLTRRSNGFKSSTLDFLVIFVILLIPNLPDVALKGHLLGFVAVKTIILYYSYEVLISEMRDLRRASIKLKITASVFILGAKGTMASFVTFL